MKDGKKFNGKVWNHSAYQCSSYELWFNDLSDFCPFFERSICSASVRFFGAITVFLDKARVNQELLQDFIKRSCSFRRS